MSVRLDEISKLKVNIKLDINKLKQRLHDAVACYEGYGGIEEKYQHIAEYISEHLKDLLIVEEE